MAAGSLFKAVRLGATLLVIGGWAIVGTTNGVEAQTRTQRAVEGVPHTLTASPRLAARPADRHVARRVELGRGKTIAIDLPADAKEVFVGNPEIANAVVRSSRKMFVIGVANGSTTIFALDADGNQILALEIQVGREPGQLHALLRAALPNAQVNAQSIGDSVVLTGTVDTVLDAQKAVDVAKGFLGVSLVGESAVEGKVINALTVRGKDQVMLRVTVAEVQRNVLKQLGINLTGNWEIAGKTLGGVVDNPLGASTQLISGTVFGAGAQIGSAVEKSVQIRAMERQGVLRTLAEPTLTAISGETAKFTAGGEIPIPTSEDSQQGNPLLGIASVNRVRTEYRPYGVQLNFTPVVLAEGRISLTIGTEVTEVDPENGFQNRGSTRIPAFRVRRMQTTVELPSGGQLVTAGLVQQTNRAVINGLPGLMRLPVLGALFRSRDYQRQETELMILVTPYIAKPTRPGQVARPDDGFADASDPSAVLLGRINRVYGSAAAPLPPVGYRGPVGFIHQ